MEENKQPDIKEIKDPGMMMPLKYRVFFKDGTINDYNTFNEYQTALENNKGNILKSQTVKKAA